MSTASPVPSRTALERSIPQAKPPIEYKAASRALLACKDLDDVRLWADKADMLALWSRLYRRFEQQSMQALHDARRLKLQSFRRMAQIAESTRPTTVGTPRGGVGDRKGANSFLLEHGITRSHAHQILRIGAIPEKKFEELLERERPPGITYAAALAQRKNGRDKERSAAIDVLTATEGASLAVFRGFCRRHSAKALAKALKAAEVEPVLKLLIEVQEWLEDFERNLPTPTR